MLQNYLTIALRHLRRHPGYTFINVFGLAIGLACCILILLFVRDELSYDRFHSHSDRLYRVILHRQMDAGGELSGAAPPAMGPTMVANFPEVEMAARFFDWQHPLIAYGDEAFYGEHFFFADPQALLMFDFELVKGHPETALDEPLTVVLTESEAARIFGDEEPVGKTLRVANAVDVRVTGVMKDLPAQSHLKINYLGSFASMQALGVSEERLRNWNWQQFFTYVLLQPGASAEALADKFPAFIERHAKPALADAGKDFSYLPLLQPLEKIHLHSSDTTFDVAERGSFASVAAFSTIALLILLVAGFNFMNLATARATRRAREVGLRKAIGAQRGQLVRQFLGESVLLALLGAILALGLVALALGPFNQFTEKALALTPTWIVLLLGVSIGAGLLAGLYPAFVLSSFRPALVLKGSAQGGARLPVLRKVLVVAQFAVSIALIIGTLAVVNQLRYLQTKDLGFDREQVVVLPLRGDEMQQNLATLKAEVERHPDVRQATAFYGIPTGLVALNGIFVGNETTERGVNLFTVDEDYLPTMGMELVAGRNFSADMLTDLTDAFLINETAARQYGWTPEEALGQTLQWHRWDAQGEQRVGPVIGVVRDFHFKSLHEPIDPLVFVMAPQIARYLAVRLAATDPAQALAHVQTLWQTRAPAYPFEYQFIDQEYEALYRADLKFGQLVSIFAGLAVLVACLGLFGLATFAAEQRRKEVGVRKVLGASVPGLVALLSWEFVRLVGFAFVVAAPLAYFVLQQWLSSFAYAQAPGVAVFAGAGLLALLIALLTVGGQAFKAANTNPVETLRYE